MSPYRPVYQGSHLTLPSHLPPHIRAISLPQIFVSDSKKKNESYLALIACIRLHQHKVLNDRLLPLKRTDMTKMLKKAVSHSHKRINVDFYSTTAPKVSEERKAYIYPIIQSGTFFQQNIEILQGSHTLCIVSLKILDSAPRLSLNLSHKNLGLLQCSLGSPKTTSINKKEWETCTSFFTVLMNSRWRRRTSRSHFRFKQSNSSIFPSFILACLNSAGELDFEYMDVVNCEYKRSETERIFAVKNWSGNKPRLVSPTYDPNNTYIAFEIDQIKNCSSPFPDDKYESFADYYSKKRDFFVSPDGKLFQVQRVWDLPTNCHLNKPDSDNQLTRECKHNDEYDNCMGLTTLFLPQDGVLENQLADPNLLLHSVMLPQILYELERMETTKYFIRHCSRWPYLYNCLNEQIQEENIRMALTAKSCSLDRFSYDRLEYLGDAVLKLIHTDALINSGDEELKKWFHCLHEGDLSQLRTVLGCNSRLSKIAQAAGIDSFILTVPLGRGTWLPSCLETYLVNNEGEIDDTVTTQINFSPSEKVIADVMESLLGLIYRNCGYDLATKVALELELSPPQSNESNHQLNIPYEHCVDEALIAKAKTFLGVESVDKYFVKEAVTHPTKPGVSNYQRLEWVGDAVLCLAARDWVYTQFESRFDVKSMVMIETILICNETLSMISFTSGLQRYAVLTHIISSLPFND